MMRTVFAAALTAIALVAPARAAAPAVDWLNEIVSTSADQASVAPSLPEIQLIRQDYEKLEFGQSVVKTPLIIGSHKMSRGLGTHSVSHIRLTSNTPITRFSASVGVDHNGATQSGAGSVVFTVKLGEKQLNETQVLRGRQEPQRIDVAVPQTNFLDLHVSDAGDGPACDHADWAEARITLADGRQFWLDELPLGDGTTPAGPFPFSFTYAGKPAHTLLQQWKRTTTDESPDGKAHRQSIHWDDPNTGLRVTCQTVRYDDYSAAEWMLFFENRGQADTNLIEDVQALNVNMRSPLTGPERYRLYRTKGGPACPADFEPAVVAIDREHPQTMTAGQGRSSSTDFPFFKIDTGRGTAIIAIGWSGMWKADLTCSDDRQLHITAGLEKTRFILHPGERVRSPRILLLTSSGDTWDANARFRRLIFDHYAAKRATGPSATDIASAKPPLPMLFCNTCFTRGGGWLNECNAENQISLINAYAPLGLEALLTDAGWFEGGWPAGAGNWNPRKDAYPDGMGPVAAAAKHKGMVYGLWFEPERVMSGTWLHKNRPQWLLHSKSGEQDTYLLNFALPEVQQYFFNIVKDFMALPGFRFYRQDFNMDPLPYWRFSDPADRQGITEMKYIEGLYAYWDSIARAWPDSIREECASGGNRIDLETVMRMHLHQKTDYWFNDEVDQASLWGLSQYLPNSTLVAHLARMDEYSFHSTMASSLCMGWIADAPDFDAAKGKRMLEKYLAVRHLLVGDWYPLLPYSRDLTGWTGFQFHRPDLDEGLLLIFRRANSPYRTVDLKLKGLDPNQTYELELRGPDGQRRKVSLSGSKLMSDINMSLPGPRLSDLVVYRKAGATGAAKP